MSGVSESALAGQVRALADLDLDQLRAAWRDHLGAPPTLRSHDHLRRLLAWRLQAEVLGGLDAEVRRMVSAGRSRGPAPLLAIGARVSREWRGVRYEVEIAEDGVLYAGKAYRSLSEVARLITGVRWNGPRFFGLRSSGEPL